MRLVKKPTSPTLTFKTIFATVGSPIVPKSTVIATGGVKSVDQSAIVWIVITVMGFVIWRKGVILNQKRKLSWMSDLFIFFCCITLKEASDKQF